MNLGDILKSVAPTLATAFLGPLAGAATSFLADKLGTSSTVEAVTQAIAGMSPADMVKMKELDVQFQEYMADNSIALAKGQIEIGKLEAVSTNWFIAGARPYIVWVCGVGLTYELLLQPIFAWLSLNLHWSVPPTLDAGTLGATVSALLGLGTMRSFEKYNDINNKH